MKSIIIIITALLFATINYAQSNIIKDGNKYYFADRVVVKYKNASTTLNKNSSNLFSKLNIHTSQETFSKTTNKLQSSRELDIIYTLHFSSPYNPIYIAKEISKLDDIEWVEPHYLYELAFQPNDPVYSDPDTLRYKHLDVIKANDAWDINKGNEDIIIAIVDTGIDWAHPDLADNIWTNSAEIDNNGIDDDENGFVDDYRGWDLGGFDGTADNDPKEDRADHGTHVAGLASAVTDNGIGIASIGFNSRLMAVKTSRDDTRSDIGTALIAYGYEGILYAADNGADIINCSWGGYSYSFAAQAVIDYAISKGALVVAAAGNDNSKEKFYPAGYSGVLSVGGTSFVDQKASWSNYGTNIDVCAPGVNIYSTWQNSPFYRSTSGTSLSSPIAAGLAALVTNQFPNYSPLQVTEQIRVNTDNLDNINPNFVNKLGSGRINAYKALANSNSKSVRISNIELIEIGDKDGIFESGENIKIVLDITNYLNPISNLSINISSQDNNLEIVKTGGSVGAMTSMQSLNTSSDLFEVSIKPNALDNSDIDILISYSDANYSDYEWITLSVNPTYQIQTTENLSITFNSTGSIGFDDYPTNLKGNGLIFNDGPNLMFEGALLYGTSASTIVNSARDAEGNKDNDFNVLSTIVLISPGNYSDKETYTKFNDASATPQSLDIETEVHSYSFADEQDANYMFIRYVFTNTTSDSIRNFYVGQYWDFDLDDTSFDDDLVSYDTTNNFGYIYDNDGDPIKTHIGLALLSSDKVGFFAMDREGTNENIISWDGFSDEEKWTALSSGLDFSSVGPSDISTLISGGPFTLEPNVKFEVDIVIALSQTFEELRSTVQNARVKYSEFLEIKDSDEIPDTYLFELVQNFPNPFNQSAIIRYSIPEKFTQTGSEESLIILKIYDALGKEVATIVNQYQKPGSYEVEWNGRNFASGVYYYQLIANNRTSIKKMILLK
jgi:serine protease